MKTSNKINQEFERLIEIKSEIREMDNSLTKLKKEEQEILSKIRGTASIFLFNDVAYSVQHSGAGYFLRTEDTVKIS